MSHLTILTIGWALALALAILGLLVVLYRVGSRHSHSWSQWKVVEYEGFYMNHRTGSTTPAMVREQERHCAECGYTQVRELP